MPETLWQEPTIDWEQGDDQDGDASNSGSDVGSDASSDVGSDASSDVGSDASSDSNNGYLFDANDNMNSEDFDIFNDGVEDDYAAELAMIKEEHDSDEETTEAVLRSLPAARGSSKESIPQGLDIIKEEICEQGNNSQGNQLLWTLPERNGQAGIISPGSSSLQDNGDVVSIPNDPGPGRPSWAAPIRLISAFANGYRDVLTIGRGLQHLRERGEVFRFVDDPQLCPRGCGWVYPLLPQFEALENHKVVLLMLLCPKHHTRVNPNEPKPSCFTDIFVATIVSYFGMSGIKCIVMNFRKECRRDRQDACCPGLTEDELICCGIATMAEVHIALNVFGIQIKATIAISASSCAGITPLEQDLDFAPLLGTIYRIQWHPRALVSLAFSGFPHEVHGLIAKDMINNDYKPAVFSIIEAFQQCPGGDLWEFIRFSLVTSPVPAYSSLFVPVVDTFELAARLRTARATSFDLRDISSVDMLHQGMKEVSRMQRAIQHLSYTQRHRYRLGVGIVQELQRYCPEIGWLHASRSHVESTQSIRAKDE
ncbi:uncharacterized protein FFNC_03656 [Fusarium fujikuroi]|nr:uncharacterized protein FFNC_03656 [Fusarium fujikuroi]